jgi:histidyl-tRNA synthetase
MKPSLPQGTRDFGPDVVRKRQYILNTIKSVFELYGFQPLETPAMENLDTLMGKYGEEGDKLIFKILNNGDLIKGIDRKDLFEASVESFTEYVKNDPVFLSTLKLLPPSSSQVQKKEFAIQVLKEFDKYLRDTYLTKRALRYDLTIPFARYVAMNHNQLTFPFKRYQMQPVWRADRPQKGRYREFYQCDADIVGSISLINEIDLLNTYKDAFQKLKIGIDIRINSRKILAALAQICDVPDKMVDITTAIDKLDKIGLEKVKAELFQRGLNENQVSKIERYLLISKYSGDNRVVVNQLQELFIDSSEGIEGTKELDYLLNEFELLNSDFLLKNKFTIDPTLARGLNYYTGTIFEIKALDAKIGSIGGGGRYDDLTGLFGVPNIPGVGISFGVDRIYDVMDELKLFPDTIEVGTRVLFFNLGAEESKTAYDLLQRLRQNGIASEIYHEPTKFDKQFKYAERKNIPFAIIIGSKEIETKTCVIKDLRSGDQKSVGFEALSEFSFV